MSFFDRFRVLTKKEPGTTALDAAALSTVQTAIERRNRKRKNARQGATALIIDDSPTVVAALRKILRSAGYVTRDAGDAETGLAMLAEIKPDLIFLDIVLPGMNGFGALRVIRKDPGTQHIPVIMISGNEHATEQFYANKIGADLFMKKPFSRYEVFAHIELLLDANRELRRKGFAAEPHPLPAKDVQEEMIKTLPVPRTAAALAAMSTPTVNKLVEWPELEARKQLTGMGLQYFDQGQFFAAIRRGDQLAVALFIAGRGVDKDTSLDGQNALAVAKEVGKVEVIQLLG
jgi:twitching motility two-component system response regulator PilH